MNVFVSTCSHRKMFLINVGGKQLKMYKSKRLHSSVSIYQIRLCRRSPAGGGCGDGGGVCSSGGAPTVGPAGPAAPFVSTWVEGFFPSNRGRSSVTGLKGSQSKKGNRWASVGVLVSGLGLCGETGSLSSWEPGWPGWNRGERLLI